jgi:hypothetical protein
MGGFRRRRELPADLARQHPGRAIDIHTGKGRGSRRRIPASQPVLGVLEMRRSGATSGWVFPAHPRSGHVEASTLKKQHAVALKDFGVVPSVLYTFRHTE